MFRDKPPPGYVPGAGRGAVGFVTRSDIGSAGAGSELGGGRGGAVPGAAAAKPGAAPGSGTFDKFSGFQEQLFSDARYDADDAEADRVYTGVDEYLAGRTKRRREAREAEAAKRARTETSRIADTLSDLRGDLAQVTSAEWDAIPEVGDRSLRYKKKATTSYAPLPDSVMLRSEARADTAIEPGAAGADGGGGGGGGATSVAPSAGSLTDIRGMSEARSQMLSMKLDKMADSVSGRAAVDSAGYLTSLHSRAASSEELSNVKKARVMAKSFITTSPSNGYGWIMAARVEEQANNLAGARKLIREGCEHCAHDQDVWLEAVRLHTPAQARLLLADGVKHMPHSVRLWITAAELESDATLKRAVLRKALTLIPNSAELWKAAISLEAPADARVLLARAVECVPTAVDMWLALARLETYDNAQRVLNQARAALPGEVVIWLAAAKLEEAAGHTDMIQRICARALKSLTAQGVVLDRDAWLRHAAEAEAAGAPRTAATLVRVTADVGVEAADRARVWATDARALQAQGRVECARAMHAALTSAFPHEEAVWTAAAEFEKAHGGGAQLDALLRRAVSACPRAEVLWLMAAKEKWRQRDVGAARAILGEAYEANRRSEGILLAAAKVEWENEELDRTRALLQRAREDAPSDRVWLKSAALERESGSPVAEERLLLEGVTRFPTAWKLWLMLGQLYARVGQPDRAAATLAAALKCVPTAPDVWIAAARLEETRAGGGVLKARAVLDAARLRNPACPPLLLEAVRLERRSGNERGAEALLATALRECPTSGVLWAEDILTSPRMVQKRKSSDALRRCENDAHVLTAVARLFWHDRKLDKARKWFACALAADPDLGDAWAFYYLFEKTEGSAEAAQEVARRAVAAEPAHGERWTAVSKLPANRRMAKADILRAVADAIRADPATAPLFAASGGAGAT